MNTLKTAAALALLCALGTTAPSKDFFTRLAGN